MRARYVSYWDVFFTTEISGHAERMVEEQGMHNHRAVERAGENCEFGWGQFAGLGSAGDNKLIM